MQDVKVKKELEQIRHKNRGVLQPADVVEFAKNPKTVLHSCFCWDDTAAAHKYRLWQAREVIRYSVTVIQGANEPTRMYVSLKSERYDAGGYRAITNVLSHKKMRQQLYDDALFELNRVKEQYQQLKSLMPVWEAIDRVQRAKVAV